MSGDLKSVDNPAITTYSNANVNANANATDARSAAAAYAKQYQQQHQTDSVHFLLADPNLPYPTRPEIRYAYFVSQSTGVVYNAMVDMTSVLLNTSRGTPVFFYSGLQACMPYTIGRFAQLVFEAYMANNFVRAAPVPAPSPSPVHHSLAADDPCPRTYQPTNPAYQPTNPVYQPTNPVYQPISPTYQPAESLYQPSVVPSPPPREEPAVVTPLPSSSYNFMSATVPAASSSSVASKDPLAPISEWSPARHGNYGRRSYNKRF